MGFMDNIRAHTDDLIALWPDTLKVERPTTTYTTTEEASETWAIITTTIGDMQPVEVRRGQGEMVLDEKGTIIQADKKVFMRYDEDIAEGDRLEAADGILYWVMAVRSHEDHKLVWLRRLLQR